MPSVVTAPFWDSMTGFLLDNNPVCPFHERYKDRRTAEFRPQMFKSVSVTPRAREQTPQEKTGICLATTFSRVSLSGGQPTGMIASAVA